MGSEMPVVNKVGALGQQRCWEVGNERKGYQSAVHLTQQVRVLAVIPLCNSLVYLCTAVLIFEARYLKSMLIAQDPRNSSHLCHYCWMNKP